MNATNYPQPMNDTEPDAKPVAKRHRSDDWIWVPVGGIAVGASRGGLDPRITLIVFVVAFGAVAVWKGRDSRERLTGALAAVSVLAAGWLAFGLLSPGWAALATIAVAVATAVTLIVWHKRRTPPEADTPVSEPTGLLPAAPEPKPRTPAERRAATERRWAQGADEHRRRQAEQAAEYEREAELRRQQGAARRLAETEATPKI